jgi:hypothetical protein
MNSPGAVATPASMPLAPSQALAGQGESLRVADVIICAMLLLSLLIRTALLTGPVGSDDLNYFRFAQQLLQWEHFSELHHHGGRLVFLALIGLPAAAFDSIYAGVAANIAMLSVRDILIVCYARKRLDTVAAISAAGILGFNAVSSAYAGLMLPDGLLSLCMFLAAALAFESVRADGGKRLLLLAGGGLLAGAGYSVKDTGILIVPCAVAWILIANSRWKAQLPQVLAEAGMFVAGFAAFVIAEMGVYYVLSGDPLYRVHAIALTHNTTGDVAEAESLYDFVRHVFWNALAVTKWDTASLPVLVMAALVWPISVAKRAPLAFFAMTGTFLAVYLIAGSSSFSRLIPLPVQDRYFEVLVPFLAVAAAGLVHHYRQFQSRDRKYAIGVGLALVVALTSLPALVANPGDITFSALGKNAAIAIKAVRSANPESNIYVSPKLYRVVRPFVPRDVYADIQVIADAGPLIPGFYILHPWLDTTERYPRATDIEQLPTYVAVDEDHRILGQLAAPAPNREIAVKYFAGG